jgi:hypothetical protein
MQSAAAAAEIWTMKFRFRAFFEPESTLLRDVLVRL